MLRLSNRVSTVPHHYRIPSVREAPQYWDTPLLGPQGYPNLRQPKDAVVLSAPALHSATRLQSVTPQLLDVVKGWVVGLINSIDPGP